MPAAHALASFHMHRDIQRLQILPCLYANIQPWSILSAAVEGEGMLHTSHDGCLHTCHQAPACIWHCGRLRAWQPTLSSGMRAWLQECEDAQSGGQQFVSSVCWSRKGHTLLAANSQGTLKLLELD